MEKELIDFFAVVTQNTSLIDDEKEFAKSISDNAMSINIKNLDNQWKTIDENKYFTPEGRVCATKNYIQAMKIMTEVCAHKQWELENCLKNMTEEDKSGDTSASTKDPEDKADEYFKYSYKIWVDYSNKRVVLDKDKFFESEDMLERAELKYETNLHEKAVSAFKDYVGNYPKYAAVTCVVF